MPLLAFCLCYMGVNAAEAMKLIYIPVYLRDSLHISVGVSGAILGFQPLLEFALMPAAVMLGRKAGAFRLLAIAALCACAGHFLFAIATTSAIFVSAAPLAGGMGGLTGGLAAAHVGLPHVFLVAASMTLVAALGLAVMAWKPGDTPAAKMEAEPGGVPFTVF